MTKRVLIVDDHPLFREGVKSLVSMENEYTVADEASDAKTGLALAVELQPDLVLLDISLPDKSGLTLLSEIRRQCPHTRTIILSMHTKSDYIVGAFQAGAMGYVAKESAAEKLIEALRTVSNGEFYLDGASSKDILQKLAVVSKPPSGNDNGSLTRREQEVMRLIAEGFAAKEIGTRLFISHKTVENHRINILKKLGLSSTMDILRYAVKIGLIDTDTWKQ